MLKLLPHLVEHLQDDQQTSSISLIYGVYDVKLKGVSPVSLCVQRNKLYFDPNNRLLQVFDMKGRVRFKGKFCPISSHLKASRTLLHLSQPHKQGAS